jgi:hypothetical protein
VSGASSHDYSAVGPAELDAYQAFFRAQYASITSAARLARVWGASVGLHDQGAVPLVVPLLRSVLLADDVFTDIVCDVHAVAPGNLWSWFTEALQPWDTLPSSVQAVLADPGACATRLTAAVAVGTDMSR